MQKFKVVIDGKTPYMQHRMDDQTLEEWEKNRKFIIERKDINQTDQTRAEFHSYQDEKGFFIPSEHIRGALINAGVFTKSKVGNSRKSMKNIVAGMFFIKEEKLRLPKNYIVDKRSAVNHNVKGRIIAIRPRWEKWNATFTLLIDNDTLTIETIKEIITNAGNYIGVGSFRPQHNGMFGRFLLKSIKKL